MKRLISILIVMMACANANAVDADSVAGKQRDSLCVSLLTCSPGDIAYTMYGHSAIRVHNITTRKDLVFNYGMFNFDEDNFIYKFVKGETDYILGAEPADFFFGRYRERGIGIVEQSLNFTQDECWHLYEILWTNIQPQNRTYRYNWLYDNCTTRARDAIERAVNGHVVYKSRPEAGTDMTALSARRMLHPFARADRWVEFGQNFVLGYEIDRPLAMRQTMFLPHKFKDYASGAVIVQEALTDAGDTILNEIPLISTTHDVLKPVAADNHANIDPPLMCFLLLFIITLVLSIFEIRRHLTFKWIDVTFCVLTGLAGILVSFLYYFSQHAGVSTNVLVIIFNPLPFIWIPFVIRRKVHILSYAILAEFILFFIAIFAVRQHLDPAIWPLVSTLLVRVLVNILLNKQKFLTLHSNSNFHKREDKGR